MNCKNAYILLIALLIYCSSLGLFDSESCRQQLEDRLKEVDATAMVNKFTLKNGSKVKAQGFLNGVPFTAILISQRNGIMLYSFRNKLITIQGDAPQNELSDGERIIFEALYFCHDDFLIPKPAKR